MAAWGARPAPQLPQKRVVAGFSVPHLAHRTVGWPPIALSLLEATRTAAQARTLSQSLASLSSRSSLAYRSRGFRATNAVSIGRWIQDATSVYILG